MEAVVFEDSPHAEYLLDHLEGEGVGNDGWAQVPHQDTSSSPPSPSFAPRGRPTVQSKFRNKLPPPLRINIPPSNAVAAIHNTCSKALNSRLGRVDNAKFLEQFRYIVVASQLLSDHHYHGQAESQNGVICETSAPDIGTFTITGAAVTAGVSFILVWMVNWARGTPESGPSTSRVVSVLVFIVSAASLAYIYIRRQWLRYLRQQALVEISGFVTKAHDLDRATGAALTLVQEVELVSRGYRISSPLPPITRLEDKSQTRRCVRLRKLLYGCLTELIPRYNSAVLTLKPLTEQLDLEKYYDIYDISDLDLEEASSGREDSEFDDKESLRVLKILAARFHTMRKVFLCCLLALNADGGKPDFLRWSTALDEIHTLGTVTGVTEERLRRILSEEDAFPAPSTPKIPMTPGRERWRAQLRKLNILSTGIRGLQAKLHVLRDESDKTLNESVDLSELGPNLMFQYESIGVDLKSLMQEWEDGKAALQNNIDRNEKRISSMSNFSDMLSPTISLGGLTSVEEGSPLDALRALNGESRSRSSMDFSSSDADEVFEAVAVPSRQRSILSREERIFKMKEDRVKREEARGKTEANTHMLRELESVINLRPRGRTAPSTRVTSL